MSWDDEQHFESDWWGDCTNTFGEELKHPTYARLMGLTFTQDGGRFMIDQRDRSILDVGGGPASMLLKTRARKRTVVDPCRYPSWTRDRYDAAGVNLKETAAEDFVADELYDEAWCYNVLEHVKDPLAVLHMMRSQARLIRLFEWVDEPPHPGHPHELHSSDLVKWGGFDVPGIESFFAESLIVWDLWPAGRYTPQPAFHGYTRVVHG